MSGAVIATVPPARAAWTSTPPGDWTTADGMLSARLDKSVFGFFTIGRREEDGCGPAWQQSSHRLADLDSVLERLGPSPVNAYISQATFFRAERRVASVSRIGALWVDLDTYKVPALRNVAPSVLGAMVLQACLDAPALPPPSLIVDSGRGLYVKWHLERALPKRALPRWSLVQARLCARLARFGADRSACDAARVLRLVGSVHGKTGRKVAVLWSNCGAPTHGGALVDGVVAYPFDLLADALLDLTRDELAALKIEREREHRRRAALMEKAPGWQAPAVAGRAPRQPWRRFDPGQLAMDRYRDIMELARLRGWSEGGAPPGQRDVPVFLCAALAAQAGDPAYLRRALPAIAGALAPTWSSTDLANCVASVLDRADAAERGETVEFNGASRDPRYTFRTATLIAWLGISDEEQEHLKTIVGKEQLRRRGAQRARAARALHGAEPRADYLATAQQRRCMAAEQRALGKSWKEVGELLDISAAAARALAGRAAAKRVSPSGNMKVVKP